MSLSDPSRVQVFLFDLDGTLVDSGGAGLRAMREAFQQVMGIQDPFRGDSFTGRTDPHIFRTAVERHLQRKPTRDEEREFFERYLSRLAVEVPSSRTYRVLPGVPDVLHGLCSRPGCLVGLCTGNLEEGARIKLARADLNRYFRFGGYGSDASDRAELTRIAVERARAIANAPLDVLVIGDSPHEVAAARANAARVALVATGWTPREVLLSLEPDLFFESLADAESCMARMLGLGESLRVRATEVHAAARRIAEGGVIIHPTSTLYGLAGNALDPHVTARIRSLKGAREAPFLVLVPDPETAWTFVSEVPPEARLLAEAFWPGALTLVLPASDRVPPHLVGPDRTIALRVDAHPFARALPAASRVPVLSTSANRSGDAAPARADEVSRDLILSCDLFVWDSSPLLGAPSTLVRVVAGRAEGLREGAVSREEVISQLKRRSPERRSVLG